MRAVTLHRRNVWVEIENAHLEDVGKRYVTLHFSGPQVSWRDPDSAPRRWRVMWDGSLPPMLHIRGLLFGVHFLVEASVVRVDGGG